MLRRDAALFRTIASGELVAAVERAQGDSAVRDELARVLGGHLDDPDGALARWGALVS